MSDNKETIRRTRNEICRYIIATSHGVFRLSVPATWKVTFSDVNPGTSRYRGENDTYCMRIYESNNKQRATLTDVQAFIVEDIDVEQAETDNNCHVKEWVGIDQAVFLLGHTASKALTRR